MMSAFLKIDPWALLAERKRTAGSKTLAGLATLADPLSQNENLSAQNASQAIPPAKLAKVAKVGTRGKFAEALAEFERECPALSRLSVGSNA